MIRPRTKDKSACLCFSLMSKAPTGKPWHRDPDNKDPSRSVVLDLHDENECYMQSVAEPKLLDLTNPIQDDMQAQCLPVAKSNYPRWMYRKVPKVSSFRSFEGISTWCWKPRQLTYHLCAEDVTRAGLVSYLRKQQKDDLLNHGVLPPDSSWQGRVYVCDVSCEVGISKAVSLLSLRRWMQLPDSLGKSVSVPH